VPPHSLVSSFAVPQIFRNTFLSLDSGESVARQTGVAKFAGFVGKTSGMCGEALSEGDIHKLMNDEHLVAAVEAVFSDLLKEALGLIGSLSSCGAASRADPPPAPFPFLRRGDWSALQLLGPAIENVRQQMRDSKKVLEIFAARKLRELAGLPLSCSVEVTKAPQKTIQAIPTGKWQRRKAKILPMMKLGLILGGGVAAKGGAAAKRTIIDIRPESLLAATLTASLSDVVKQQHKKVVQCSYISQDDVSSVASRTSRMSEMLGPEDVDSTWLTTSIHQPAVVKRSRSAPTNLVFKCYSMQNPISTIQSLQYGRAASGGALSLELPRDTRSTPEPIQNYFFCRTRFRYPRKSRLADAQIMVGGRDFSRTRKSRLPNAKITSHQRENHVSRT